MHTILFICTGNTCRSPMAEAIAQRWLDGRPAADHAGRHLVVSAGVAAAEGSPASPEAVEALDRLGIRYEGRSTRLTAEMVRNADVVLCMTAGHVAAASALVDDARRQKDKILRLDPSGDVADPIGMGQDAYHALAQRFTEIVPQRLQEVLFDEDRAGIGSSRR